MILWATILAACATPAIPVNGDAPLSGEVPVLAAASAPAGAACDRTSCSLGDDAHVGLSDTEFVALLDTWAQEPLGESTLALDTLLFDAEQSAALLAVYGDRLPADRRAWLERELARTDVVIEMRIVDEAGEVRGVLESGAFPIREKQHLPFSDTGSLGWLETGGKIKRVGLAHLWSRW